MNASSNHHFNYLFKFVVCVFPSETINVLVENYTRVWAGVTGVVTVFEVPSIVWVVDYRLMG